MKKILIIGCGRLGKNLAAKELAAGNQVIGVCRSSTSKEQLEKLGVMAISCDLDSNPDLNQLSLAKPNYLYYLLAPDSKNDKDNRMSQILNCIDNFNKLETVVLISTTGVYGDCAGEWVDEARVPKPLAARAKRRLDAEAKFNDWAKNNSLYSLILRVPGIYSADRLPLKRIIDKVAVLKPSDAPFSNRVHELDLVNILYLSMRAKLSQEILNVADEVPSTMSDYFLAIAKKFSLQTPPLISRREAEKQFSSEMMSYLSESRKIDNRKLKELLSYEYLYPDLNSGLNQCLEETEQKVNHRD